MIGEKNPHTVRFDEYQLVYWRNGVASGADNADRVQVQQFVSGCGYSTIQEFNLPDQQWGMEQLCRALSRAFEAGKAAQQAAFRKMLGIA